MPDHHNNPMSLPDQIALAGHTALAVSTLLFTLSTLLRMFESSGRIEPPAGQPQPRTNFPPDKPFSAQNYFT